MYTVLRCQDLTTTWICSRNWEHKKKSSTTYWSSD